MPGGSESLAESEGEGRGDDNARERVCGIARTAEASRNGSEAIGSSMTETSPNTSATSLGDGSAKSGRSSSGMTSSAFSSPKRTTPPILSFREYNNTLMLTFRFVDGDDHRITVAIVRNWMHIRKSGYYPIAE